MDRGYSDCAVWSKYDKWYFLCYVCTLHVYYMQQTADDRLYYHAPLMHAALTLPSLLPLLVHNCSHTYRSLIRLLFIFHLKSCGNIDFMEKLIGVHFSVQKRSPAASAHPALFEIGHFPRGPSNEVWPYLRCHKRCLIPTTRTSHWHLISFTSHHIRRYVICIVYSNLSKPIRWCFFKILQD